MKSPFKSKTLQGVVMTLAGSAMAAAPAILANAAAVDPRIGLAVSVGGAIYAAYGRMRAKETLGP